MLTGALRDLEASGFVVRTEVPGSVVRVRYALADEPELRIALQSLLDFGEGWALRTGTVVGPVA